ncbi:MAG: bifunctional folylpolyglutamate synthase/dihydrofolate synthase [Deltaproteobacteria bacterium]|nr:bifunctional folylpolyglutamate synthase/dihydrofolate synthase [Deltaproteobacteria bacterium]
MKTPVESENKDKTTYKAAIEYLFSLQKFGIKFGLSKTENLLEALGNPHLGQNYIHIAGTNGKGSVAAFMGSILQEAGYRVGMYISPHLVRFTERFSINGEEISREKTVELIDELQSAFNPDEPPTFFEAVTAMAFLYFAREKTDIAIMEVGMGGRLDATNVMMPLVTGITNISMEHQEYLGNQLSDIAREKAGVIKKGVDVVTAVTQPRIIDQLKAVAEERGAPFRRVGKEVKYRSTPSGLHFFGQSRSIKGLQLGLRGIHQARNAALALGMMECIETKGFPHSTDQISRGLAKADWPGRMQVIRENPTILLDGAHNSAAVKALVRSILSDFSYDKMILVIGIMADKDIAALLRAIVPISDQVLYTRPVYSRAADPGILMEKAQPLNVPGEIVPSLAEALKKAEALATAKDLIVVCGSLFTVGEALTCFDPIRYHPSSEPLGRRYV